MRNLVAHVYFGVDIDTVWSTVALDLPQLQTALAVLLDRTTE